jgi:hypothetical protein
MVHIPYLQPFLDVNKRVSRLGANIPLIKHNLSPLSFVDVPEQAYVEGTLGVYELNRFELLRDVFVWAYERSCQRYVAIKESLPEPDPLRLRNREALISVVSEIVRGGKQVDMRTIRGLATPLVPPADLGEFVAMAFTSTRSSLVLPISSPNMADLSYFIGRPSLATRSQCCPKQGRVSAEAFLE